MIDIILYTITLYARPFVVVSLIILVIGFLLYYLSKRFDIHKKSTRYLGLLTRNKSKANIPIICYFNKNNISDLCINR